jgi:type IV pilus assembly protein PilY1
VELGAARQDSQRATRKVFTFKPGVGGVEFKLLADLDATQAGQLSGVNCSAALTGTACAQARIDWLRGDQSKEDPAGPLRKRSKVHGDVISSGPTYDWATKTVYVGANDGLLHAIDASNGNELFSYLPNALFPKLHKLTQTSYAHDYYVDGEIAVSTSFQTPGKSILVGALGRGGKGLLRAGCHRTFDLRSQQGVVGVHRQRPGPGTGRPSSPS